ncbi:unnamed protein product, partial [Didymodactylos carnosus]
SPSGLAFHAIIPQYLLPLRLLLIIFTAAVMSVITGIITALKYVNFQINYFYVVLFGLLYSLIGCLLLYLLLAIFFPLLSSSSSKLELVDKTWQDAISTLECNVILSKFPFTSAWRGDIGQYDLKQLDMS